MDGMQEIFKHDFSAYGAAGYGVTVYAGVDGKGETVFQADFKKGWPNKDNAYIVDADGAGFLMRVCIDRFCAWCPQADDYDVALFASVLANRVHRYCEHVHDGGFASV